MLALLGGTVASAVAHDDRPVGLLLTAPSLAGPPQLRIEAGQHTTRIQALAIDGSGRYAVTGSWDKTARVWSIPGPNGAWELLRVLRPPIGKGDDGKIYTVAMSPDGSKVALGGWLSANGTHAVYVFDRASGQVLQRMPLGQVTVSFSLAFSRDGRRLAAGHQNGVRVWRVADGRVAADLKEPSDNVLGLDFGAAGELLVSSYDGQLRLYHPDLSLNRITAFGGKRPNRIVFSPKGEKFAVTDENSAYVEIRRTSDLRRLAKPDVSGMELSKNLWRIAWSKDGRVLVGGGTGKSRSAGWANVVRAWNDKGERRWDTAVSSNTVGGLAMLPDGRTVYATMVPQLGVISPQGKLQQSVGSPLVDMRDARPPSDKFDRPLRLSIDGREVSWP